MFFFCFVFNVLLLVLYRVILDGFSEFIVSTEGQIVEHKMDRLTPSKHHSLVRSLLPKRLEAFLPNRQPTITSTQSS